MQCVHCTVREGEIAGQLLREKRCQLLSLPRGVKLTVCSLAVAAARAESPVAAEMLSQDPWHKFGKWGMAVVRAVEFTEPVTGVSGKMGPWRLKDEAIKAKILAALRCGTLRTFRP